jgi:hypothetical protein
MKDDRFTAQHADHQGQLGASLERMGAGTTTLQVAQLLKNESAYGSSSPAQSGISSGFSRSGGVTKKNWSENRRAPRCFRGCLTSFRKSERVSFIS